MNLAQHYNDISSLVGKAFYKAKSVQVLLAYEA